VELEGKVPNVGNEILRRCSGKQTPITPHAQRLLSAEKKQGKLGKGKDDGKGCGNGKGKGKGNGKGKGKGKCKGKAKKKAQKPKGSDSKSKPPSDYAKAKADYMAKFLDSNSRFQWLVTTSSEMILFNNSSLITV